MDSFEWMEVEALSGEIAALDARLAQATARHNHGLVEVLKEQIAVAQMRRTKYLANISTSLANSLDASPPATGGVAEKQVQKDREKIAEPQSAEPADETAAEAAEKAAVKEQQEPEPEPEIVAEAQEESAAEASADTSEVVTPEVDAQLAEPKVAEEAIAPMLPSAEAVEPVVKSRIASPGADATRRVGGLWSQLSASDIEQAKRQLDTRRAEMLARHAEELKALEADQVQIDTLAQAIDTFLRKFCAPSDDSSVMRPDEKREVRQLG